MSWASFHKYHNIPKNGKNVGALIPLVEVKQKHTAEENTF